MISNRWLEGRRRYWERLAALLSRTGSGLKEFSGAELRELGLLYRQTASDLSAVAEDPSSIHLAAYLNQLLGKSHNVLYRGRPHTRSGFFAFFRDEVPRVFRETLPMTALATAVFLAGAIAGALLTSHDPAFGYRILGPKMMESIEHRKMWTESLVAVKPAASSFIATNNLTVAFSMFALGITGVGTLWLLLFNGIMLGVVGVATAHAGMAMPLWIFVAPHGALELPAICIAGGAGLELARGLIFPALLPRRESLARAGRRAVTLIIGIIPVLLVAGTIEGFFSPGDAPAAMKLAVSSVMFVSLLIYLFWKRPLSTRPRKLIAGFDPSRASTR